MATPKNQLRKGLKDYLECEELLNSFFTKVNFCVPKCISKPIGIYRTKMEMPGDPTQFPGRVGCCPYNMFNFSNYPEISDHTLLDAQRVEKYGKPKEQRGACDYHSSEGCILKDHKSPVCLAFVCQKFTRVVCDTFDVYYHEEEIERGLELVLSGRQSPEETHKFKEMLKGLVDAVGK